METNLKGKIFEIKLNFIEEMNTKGFLPLHFLWSSSILPGLSDNEVADDGAFPCGISKNKKYLLSPKKYLKNEISMINLPLEPEAIVFSTRNGDPFVQLVIYSKNKLS